MSRAAVWTPRHTKQLYEANNQAASGKTGLTLQINKSKSEPSVKSSWSTVRGSTARGVSARNVGETSRNESQTQRAGRVAKAEKPDGKGGDKGKDAKGAESSRDGKKPQASERRKSVASAKDLLKKLKGISEQDAEAAQGAERRHRQAREHAARARRQEGEQGDRQAAHTQARLGRLRALCACGHTRTPTRD